MTPADRLANKQPIDWSVAMLLQAARAEEVADKLCSHERWLRLKIDAIESIEGFERAVRRAWALWTYTFDKTPIAKGMVSSSYSYYRFGPEKVVIP